MKLLKHIFSFAAVALALGACSSEEPAVPEQPAETCELVVTLDTGAGTLAKAPIISNNPWEDGYPEEEGTEMENTVKSVNIYFIPKDNDGSKAVAMTPTDVSGSNGHYEYRIKISVGETYVEKKADGDFAISGRIVALANYPEAAPANPLAPSAFDINEIYKTSLIPMWGVTSFTDLTLRVNHTSNAGTVKLLRSVPKITFMLDDEIKNEYDITAVTPVQTNYLKLANCQPSGALTAVTTQSLKTEDCYNPVLASTEYSSPYFYNLNSSKVWCYPAERVTQLGTSGQPYSYKVTLKRKNSNQPAFSGTVFLCDYKDGMPAQGTTIPCLVRNHDYQYIISLSELKFLISFKEWKFGGNVHLELE